MARQGAMGVEDLIIQKVAALRRWRKTKLFKRQSRWMFTFKVMTYNILSQSALDCHMNLYRKCNSTFLQENYRVSKILPEILRSSSDIICLQEVEQQVYDYDIREYFEENGFASIFKRRTGNRSDGCAILWRQSKFLLVNRSEIEFRSKNSKLLNRDNIGLIAVFQPTHPLSANIHLHVATTHLLFNPKRGDVKLGQLRWLLAELDRMALKGVENDKRTYHPVILCGDFNFEPNSSLYQFVESGFINVTNAKSGDLSGQLEGKDKGPLIKETSNSELQKLGISEATRFELDPSKLDSSTATNSNNSLEGANSAQILNSSSSPDTSGGKSPILVIDVDESSKSSEEEKPLCFYHDFKFVPVYKFDGRSNLITSMTGSDLNCVDHIFYNVKCKRDNRSYDEGCLRLLSYASLMYAEDVKELGGLPNAALGSDHILLMADFALNFRPR